jgi:hypothetical protein
MGSCKGVLVRQQFPLSIARSPISAEREGGMEMVKNKRI